MKKHNKIDYSLNSFNQNRVRKLRIVFLVAIVMLSIIFINCVQYFVDEYKSNGNQSIETTKPIIENIGDKEYVSETSNDIYIEFVGPAYGNGQYNIWFDVKTIFNEGVVKFKTNQGVIILHDNDTNTTLNETVNEINISDLSRYTLIWIFNEEDDEVFADLTVSIDTKTFIKEASMYIYAKEEYIGFLTKESYENFLQQEANQ